MLLIYNIVFGIFAYLFIGVGNELHDMAGRTIYFMIAGISLISIITIDMIAITERRARK
jgi:hypothetical protein